MSTLALKYLQFAEKRQQIRSKYNVHSRECEILRVIAQNHLLKSSLKVRNLLDMSHIASPATIHKIMKSLIAKDLIKISEDKNDGRVKYLIPTNSAIRVFADIGQMM